MLWLSLFSQKCPFSISGPTLDPKWVLCETWGHKQAKLGHTHRPTCHIVKSPQIPFDWNSFSSCLMLLADWNEVRVCCRTPLSFCLCFSLSSSFVLTGSGVSKAGLSHQGRPWTPAPLALISLPYAGFGGCCDGIQEFPNGRQILSPLSLPCINHLPLLSPTPLFFLETDYHYVW